MRLKDIKTSVSKDIAKKFRSKKTVNEFESWARDEYNDMVISERMFKGYTSNGHRRYSPYTMDNVLKEMTQKLQGGEAFFYGAGSVRST